MRPAEPEVWSLRLSSSSSLSLSLFSGFSFVGSLLFLSADYGSWERPNEVFFFFYKRFSEKGSLKASAGAPYQPHTTEQHWRLSLPAVLYPTCNTTCHHFLDPSLSLSFSFSSLSLSHVLKAFLPRLTFLSSLKSFLLSACHLLFHLSFPSSYPFTSISRTLSHVLAVFLFFFLFSLCVFSPTRLSRSCSRRLYFFAIHRSLGSLSIGIAAATKQTALPICIRNKRGFCCLFLEDDLKPPS